MVLIIQIIVETDENENHHYKNNFAAKNIFAEQNKSQFSPVSK